MMTNLETLLSRCARGGCQVPLNQTLPRGKGGWQAWHSEHLPCKAISPCLCPPPTIKRLNSKCTFPQKRFMSIPFCKISDGCRNHSCYYRYFLFLLAAESREFFDSPPSPQCWFFHFHKQSEGTGDEEAVQLPLLWTGSRERWHSLGFGLLQICFLWFVIKALHIFHFSTFCGCGSRRGEGKEQKEHTDSTCFQKTRPKSTL